MEPQVLTRISELFEEWKELKELANSRVNACFVYEDKKEYIRFVYQPPNRNFVALSKFLGYRHNIFYETLSGQKINHENAEIKAVRSRFIHTYISSDGGVRNGGQGTLTYYPNLKGTSDEEEPCRCPQFLTSNEYAEFTSIGQPKYKLFKLKNFAGGTYADYLTNEKGKYPVFHTLDLEEVDSPQSQGLQTTVYFLLPDGYEKGNMTSMPRTI